jgi:arylformamidase
MTRMIDVTVPMSAALPRVPGDPGFELELVQRIGDGEPCNVSKITMGAHSGTHVDAPYHFLADGPTIEQLSLEILMGKCRVIEVAGRDRIDRPELEALDLRDDIRILLKTRMSGQLRHPEFRHDFVHLTPEAATYLVQAGLKLVGVDYLSVEKLDSTGFPVHHTLLGAGVVIIEGLDLSQVEPGEYELTCLPLLIAGGDGAPARVVLKKRM